MRWGKTRLNYLRWRMANWRGGYGEFYSATIANHLESGRIHRTLGTQTSDKPGAPAWAALEFEKRGTGMLADLAAFGLTPDKVCVDYGCGSLRVGQHLIAMQEPGKYWGLDVTDKFFRPALDLLPPDLVADRRPHIQVIDDAVLTRLEQLQPDFVFSYAVLQHVPPREVDAFFDRFMRLVGPRTLAVIYFADGLTQRTAPMTWLHPGELIVGKVLQRRGDAAVGITRVGPHFEQKRRHPRSILWIAGSEVEIPVPSRLLALKSAPAAAGA